jgi:hypothetical protein
VASGNVDFNADVDVDGTLETDALTINGVASVPFEAADHSKLDGIEANADVTDATNVTAAGALMDSELTNITAVKALNQGVATTDSPTFAGITTTADISLGDNDKAVFGAGNDLQIYHDGSNSLINDNGTGSLQLQTGGATKLEVLSTGVDITGLANLDNLTINGTQGSDGQVLTSTGSGVQWEDAAGGGAWTVISSSTVSSAVATLEITGITGYTHYMVDISSLKSSTNKEFQVECTYGSESAYTTANYMVNKVYPGAFSSGVFGERLVAQAKARISRDMSSSYGGVAQLWFGSTSSVISYRTAAFEGTSMPVFATGTMANSTSGLTDAAIKKLRFSFQTGNIDAGTFTLYGLSIS